MADVLSDENVPPRIWSTFYLPPQLGQRLWPHFKLVKRVKQLCCHFLSSATMQSCLSYQIDSFYDFLLARSCWRIWLPRAVKLQRCYLDWLEMFTQAETNAIVSHKVGKNLTFGELSLYFVVIFSCHLQTKCTEFTSFCPSDDCGLIWNLKWHQYGVFNVVLLKSCILVKWACFGHQTSLGSFLNNMWNDIMISYLLSGGSPITLF